MNLATTNRLLGNANWQSASLKELVQAAVEPERPRQNITAANSPESNCAFLVQRPSSFTVNRRERIQEWLKRLAKTAFETRNIRSCRQSTRCLVTHHSTL